MQRPVHYRDVVVGEYFRDLLVENVLLVELPQLEIKRVVRGL
jgi:hypothetical protein